MGEPARTYRYGESYRETVQLNDGSRLRLRPVRPSDRELIRQGFERLSADSRYARFMTPKSDITDRELRYFSEVDGFDHFAICALRTKLVARDEGVGTGRFVRLPGLPDTAEPAVTILDEFQGKGLGTIFLERLLEAAWERDIRWFRFELLADNLAMKRLLQSLSPDAEFQSEGAGCLVATFPVPEPDVTPTEPGLLKRSTLFRVFGQVARADFTYRPRATFPPPPPPVSAADAPPEPPE